MPVVSRPLSRRSAPRAALALAIATVWAPAFSLDAATYDYANTSSSPALWADPNNWTVSGVSTGLYPGGDINVIDDIANLRLNTGVGQFLVNYTGMTAASIAGGYLKLERTSDACARPVIIASRSARRGAASSMVSLPSAPTWKPNNR